MPSCPAASIQSFSSQNSPSLCHLRYKGTAPRSRVLSPGDVASHTKRNLGCHPLPKLTHPLSSKADRKPCSRNTESSGSNRSFQTDAGMCASVPRACLNGTSVFSLSSCSTSSLPAKSQRDSRCRSSAEYSCWFLLAASNSTAALNVNLCWYTRRHPNRSEASEPKPSANTTWISAGRATSLKEQRLRAPRRPPSPPGHRPP
mmetsp:Transcript_25763/g.73611  ORF Transcript_25763/g.73611 Transcript_25763/m.73611 type:complete len:202 (-) Transcript_25763:176-781(-)